MTKKLEEQIYEYWQRQPCGIWHSKHPVGTKKYFLEISEHRRRTIDETNLLTEFVKFDQWKNKRVLEIGCGIGTDGARFAESGAKYTGIDISDRAISIAQQRFNVFDLPGTLQVADGSKPLTGLGKFDLVYSSGVIHHWPNMHGFISNIFNCLTNSGSFIFVVYAKHSWDYAMSKTGLAQYEAQNDCPYVDVYTEEDIREFLTPHFEIDQIIQTSCFMYNVEKYRQRELVLEPWFAAMSETMRAAVHQHLGKYYYVSCKKSKGY